MTDIDYTPADESDIEELSEPVVVEKSDLESLREEAESETVNEELQQLVDEVTEIFADELAEYSPFDAEELQDRFSPTELREKVEAHDEASVAGELGASEEDPEPEGGSVDPEELNEGDEASEEETREALREKVAESLEQANLGRQARKVREGEIELDELNVEY